MNKQDFLKTQSCVLRVNIHCHGCKSKVKKILQKIDGVYTISIDSEQGKVTVTGNVDPSVLIKKLEKNGKHAELWGPSSKGSNQINQLMNLNNQFKNFQLDGGKMGKDNNFSNKMMNPPQKGGKEQQKGGGQQQQQQHQQLQQQLQQQQHLQQLLQQMKGGAKDFKMPPKDQKSVKFNLDHDDDDDDDDDEFDDDDDEFSDEYDDDDEFDDEDDEDEDGEDDHAMYGKHGHHPPSKINIPIMGNGGGLGGKLDGDKKGKGGNGDKKGGGGGGGGGGMAGIFKGMLGGGGGKSDSKKGNEGKKDGKNGGSNNTKGGGGGDYQNIASFVGGGKNGSEGKIGKHDIGIKNNKGGSHNGGGNHNIPTNNGMVNHVKNGGFNTMGQGPMVRPMPVPSGLPAHPHMMTSGGGGGFHQGMGPPAGGPYGGGGNPQQQQYMAMMMNQQRMNGGDGYAGQPMMYGRPPMGVGYAPPMIPPPSYHDRYTSIFSDENTNSCSIM